jgi:hypothetical protein
LYEPLWDDLYARAAKSGIRIRSIWIADMWNQGQSGVLNEAILANDRKPPGAGRRRSSMGVCVCEADQFAIFDLQPAGGTTRGTCCT